MNIPEIFNGNKILPVVTISDPRDANKIADNLLAKNINIIEVTLRTEAAIEAIKLLAQRNDIIVGAGTITSEEKFEKTKAAGAKFFVSPGATTALFNYAAKNKLAFIPGAATASEVILAYEYGFSHLKFFPAEAAGGIKMLKSFAPVFQNISFCPTGGLTETNYKDYLALENVFAVGGSWVDC